MPPDIACTVGHQQLQCLRALQTVYPAGHGAAWTALLLRSLDDLARVHSGERLTQWCVCQPKVFPVVLCGLEVCSETPDCAIEAWCLPQACHSRIRKGCAETAKREGTCDVKNNSNNVRQSITIHVSIATTCSCWHQLIFTRDTHTHTIQPNHWASASDAMYNCYKSESKGQKIIFFCMNACTLRQEWQFMFAAQHWPLSRLIGRLTSS